MIRTVKKWKTPISEMNESQLIEVLDWLSEEHDFRISLGGSGNYMCGVIVWDNWMHPTVRKTDVVLTNPQDVFIDNPNMHFFEDFDYLIRDFYDRLKVLAKEKGMSQKAYFEELHKKRDGWGGILFPAKIHTR